MSRLQHNVVVVIVAVVVCLLNKVYNSRSQAENKWISDGCVIRINYEKSLSLSTCDHLCILLGPLDN